MIKDREKLAKYLAAWQGVGLDYNAFDCARFAAGWAVECGRPDPLDMYRKWYSKRQALKVIKDNGGRLLEAVTVTLGQYRELNELSWGAVVCQDAPPFDALGILDGSRVVCLSIYGGFRHAPRAQFAQGWNM